MSATSPVSYADYSRGDESDSQKIQGLLGRTEIRRAAGGYWEVWPRPTPEDLQSLYGERFYETDKSTYLEDVERERSYWDAIWSMRRQLIEAALPSSRKRLLDVGSSGGFLLDHFAQYGWTTEGIEPSPNAALYAREHFGADVFCGELLDFEPSGAPEEARFDAIHSAQVLEHVLDPEACVTRIAELLVPNGVAFIEVPNDFSVLQEAAKETLGTSAWWVAPDHHLNYFDYDSLSSLLARNGLVEIDRLASFPMELFLLMGDDYVGQPEVGAACHQRRMRFEHALIDTGRIDALASIYRALGQAGVGRTCGILARKQDVEDQRGPLR